MVLGGFRSFLLLVTTIKIFMALVLHNPKDIFLFCSVHQHGGDDVS